jgi:hypothetical protein
MSGSPIAVKVSAMRMQARREVLAEVKHMEGCGGANYGTTGSFGTVGMFDVDEVGRLRATLPAAKLAIEFCWHGRPVAASLYADGDRTSGSMVLRAEAGRLPSSAIAASSRPDAFALLGLLPALLPDNWKLMVGADHTLRLEAEMTVSLPALVGDLLVPAVQFCLTVSPYLDLLEENAMGMRA